MADIQVEVGDSLFVPTADDLIDETREGCVQHVAVVRVSQQGGPATEYNRWKATAPGFAKFERKLDGERVEIEIRITAGRQTFYFIDDYPGGET